MARSGLEVQCATINALFLREMRTRFGKYQLGYCWALLEPAAHLMLMISVFGYLMHRAMPDISYPVFLINGIIPYFLFSSITNRSVNAIEANRGLFNYRPVKPIDTIISRCILEVVISIAVYIFLASVLKFLGEDIEVDNFLTLCCAWFFLILLSCGIGLIFMVIGSHYPETEKFLPIVIKPFYFISCVMFPLHSIPKDYWPYILWNPIVHVVELCRNSVVPGYSSEGVDLRYLAMCSLLVLFIGLAVYKTQEEKMLTS